MEDEVDYGEMEDEEQLCTFWTRLCLLKLSELMSSHAT
jgi:hypothetical protein